MVALLLKPYRDRIDALDEQIVDLLAERLAVIKEVGALKAREGIPAVIPERVEEVRRHACTYAESLGVDPSLTFSLYTLLITYCCDLEETIIHEQNKDRQA